MIKNKNIITIIKRRNSIHRVDNIKRICLSNKRLMLRISRALRNTKITVIEIKKNMRLEKRSIMIKKKEILLNEEINIGMIVDKILIRHKEDTIEMIETINSIKIQGIKDMKLNQEIHETMTDMIEDMMLEILETIETKGKKEIMIDEEKEILEKGMSTNHIIETEENNDLRRMLRERRK